MSKNDEFLANMGKVEKENSKTPKSDKPLKSDLDKQQTSYDKVLSKLKKDSEFTRTMSVRVPNHIYEYLQKEARKTGVSLSAIGGGLVHEAVEEKLSN